jgi:cell division protein FtsI (penicillin-binding protein 3)
MDVRKDILWRVYLSFIAMVGLGVLVLGRTLYIQQIQGGYWREEGKKKQLKFIDVGAERGTIFSEDGNILSTSVPIYDIYVDFMADGLREKNGQRYKDNIDSLSFLLAALFKDKSNPNHKTAAQFRREMDLAYQNKARYYLLLHKISFVEFDQLRDFPLVRMGKYKSGFMPEMRDKRINPYILLANRTIGLTREKSGQNVGLEQRYDEYLRGTTGKQLMRYISGGVYLPVEGVEVEPENGKDIVTTLDTYMQDVAENALMKMLVNNNSLHGTAIVMETGTGKIKAIANLGKQVNKKDSSFSYTEDLNYGIGKATEPGSVFKLATTIALMEDGYVTKNSMIDCEGGVKSFYGLRIKDSHLGTGVISVKDAFLRSSNVAFAKLAEQYYHHQPNKFIEHLHRLRLDTLTGVDITAASGRPTIKKPSSKSWSKTTIPYMAHGYEELVTPLHMLMIYNAVANNGQLMKPYLVNSIQQYGLPVKTMQPEVLVQKICKDEVLQQLRECLAAVVDSVHGTGHRILYDSAYKIAGKTGTAVTALNNKGYNKGNKIYQSSFIGYFPANQPKYTIAVVIQNTRESKLIYGADVSGRVFKEISDRIYSRYIGNSYGKMQLQRDTVNYEVVGLKNELDAITTTLKLPVTDSSKGGYWRSMQLKENKAGMSWAGSRVAGVLQVPTLIGLGLKDAVYLAENKGLKLEIKGRGKVINQSLQPGTTFKKGQLITIFLN